MEQKTAQLQLESMQTENQTKISFAKAQDALSAERYAKVQEERTLAQQQMYKADEEKTASILNLVKALGELKNLDLVNLQAKVDILKSLSGEDENAENKPAEKTASQESAKAS
jgi:hypothetical protein